jgi:hypothetical protein
VAIEQFDAAGGVDPRPIVAFGDGFFEHEYDPGSGRQWRWLGARGELWYLARSGGRLEIEGESPRRYYTSGSRLTVRAGGTILKDVRLEDDFTIRVDVPPSGEPAAIVLDTDQTHVPAETSWRRSGDRRRLGLRIFRCELQPHP